MGKVTDIQKYTSNNSTIITIGTFDGVHIGHQKILKKLVNIAKESNLKATVLTFFPHPRMVLQKDSKIKLIHTIKERAEILNKIGVDNLVIQKFTKEFSRLTAEEFVKNILVEKLNIKTIIIGYDHHFGRNRTANIEDLKAFGKLYNFNVIEIPVQDIDDVSISSTKIRSALKEGNITVANKYLGYPFVLTGTVVKGKGLGKTIKYPTANINIEEDYKLIPKNGVYIVSSTIEGKLYYGMMNIGINPTVDGTEQTIEVHFFNFNKDIYNQKLQINLLKRIRDEVKFDSIKDLQKQLTKDRITALNFIEII